jgi:hypothetical protein
MPPRVAMAMHFGVPAANSDENEVQWDGTTKHGTADKYNAADGYSPEDEFRN